MRLQANNETLSRKCQRHSLLFGPQSVSFQSVRDSITFPAADFKLKNLYELKSMNTKPILVAGYDVHTWGSRCRILKGRVPELCDQLLPRLVYELIVSILGPRNTRLKVFTLSGNQVCIFTEIFQVFDRLFKPSHARFRPAIRLKLCERTTIDWASTFRSFRTA